MTTETPPIEQPLIEATDRGLVCAAGGAAELRTRYNAEDGAEESAEDSDTSDHDTIDDSGAIAPDERQGAVRPATPDRTR